MQWCTKNLARNHRHLEKQNKVQIIWAPILVTLICIIVVEKMEVCAEGKIAFCSRYYHTIF